MKKINLNKEFQVADFRYDEGLRGRTESDVVPTLTTKSSGISGLPLILNNGGGGNLR